MAGLPTAGRSASGLGPQPSVSQPEPTPTSAYPMSVSLVVIRLELAGHSPVPADFGFSAAGESAASRRVGESAGRRVGSPRSTGPRACQVPLLDVALAARKRGLGRGAGGMLCAFSKLADRPVVNTPS